MLELSLPALGLEPRPSRVKGGDRNHSAPKTSVFMAATVGVCHFRNGRDGANLPLGWNYGVLKRKLRDNAKDVAAIRRNQSGSESMSSPLDVGLMVSSMRKTTYSEK